MFGWSDIPSAIWAFFIVLPLVSFIHELGHYAVTRLFGGKISLTIGRGKLLFKLGGFELRRVYFVDSFCQIKELKVSNRLTHALVYLGGPLFNLLTIVIVNSLIHAGVIEPHMVFYQFAYFSLYFIFFALIPIEFGKGYPSDGKALYDVLKYGTDKDPLE
ncbi:hypothetical protein CR205_14430 [Alteribacter lacisalsi]|uniref:Peptidase M50 domain-containing protein n=1 Tax=Alteribacter lacisalsi TaxID=2045244 RepID=A0A2W0H9Y7_9BACI|nr:site-2 protease family protein [Alteribacter lacisalsi]PYZ96870.1 hypothetical protein CR205_14430 [Alteribacter lacisalsi]